MATTDINRASVITDPISGFVSGNRVTNFNEWLVASYQGGFIVDKHGVSPHPEYPTVSDYGANTYGNFAAAESPCCLDPDDPTKLYVVGFGGGWDNNDQEEGGIDSVAQVTIPPLVKNSRISDVSNFNYTTLDQNWRGLLKHSDLTYDEVPQVVTSLHVSGQRLFAQTMRQYDTAPYTEYNAVCLDNKDDLANANLIGMFDFQPAGEAGKAAHASTWISNIPSEWQSQLGGHKHAFGGGANLSIVARLPTGPTFFTGTIPDTLPDPATNPRINLNRVMAFENETGKQLGHHLYPAEGDFWDWGYFNADMQYAIDNYDGYMASAGNDPDGVADYDKIKPWINDWWTVLTYGTYGFIIPNTKTYCVIGYAQATVGGSGYKAESPEMPGLKAGPTRLLKNDSAPYYWLFDMDELLALDNYYDAFPYEYGAINCFNDGTRTIDEKALTNSATFCEKTGRLIISMVDMVGSTGSRLNSYHVFQNDAWKEL